MTASPNTWIHFWNEEKIFTSKNWSKSMELFVKGSYPVLNYQKSDDVLDIGCGPGFFEMMMQNRVQSITGLDTSERYIEQCRNRFNNSEDTNLVFKLLSNDVYDFSSLAGRAYDKIICVSVVQYFKNVAEIEKLILGVAPYAKPGSLFLISDIPCHDSKSTFIFSLLTAFKNKYFWEQVRFIIKARFSTYYDQYKSNGLLTPALKDLEAIINNIPFKARILETPMSLDTRRKHILVQY